MVEPGRVVVYTDGACEPNPGIGGWAAILVYRGHVKEVSGGDPQTTNNRMELMAAIAALEALKRSAAVTLRTDSQYLKNGITTWLPKWKRFHWTRRGSELKNVDLWQRLDALTQRHDVRWEWVRGHAGDPLNERCDELACAEVRRIREQGARG